MGEWRGVGRERDGTGRAGLSRVPSAAADRTLSVPCLSLVSAVLVARAPRKALGSSSINARPPLPSRRDHVQFLAMIVDSPVFGVQPPAVDRGSEFRLVGKDGMQRDCGKLMELNKAKCNVLSLGPGHPKPKHKLGGKGIEHSPGCPKTPVPGGILPHSGETPPAEVTPAQRFQQRKDVELLEPVQRRSQRSSKGWSPSSLEPGWESWGYSSGESSRETLEALPVLKGAPGELERTLDQGLEGQDKGEWLPTAREQS
ncbi:hypothetical protein DUI87_29301 [Hirundo rustica rustica]|uniref:Uncharacterized protein n=1 Tax=Hirundo rustica rustica TaxID=333673 RepID=A0A3M0J2E6_HIRRU|nr:hypothetical protein DUI87_29301 [Hirundo rustica rustica]